MLLFVGQAASKEDIEKIADLNWFMVFTTKDMKPAFDLSKSELDILYDAFNTNRRTIQIIDPDSQIIGTDKILNIIRIRKDPDSEEDEWFDQSPFSEDYKKFLQNFMINNAQFDLIVLGFDEKKDKDSGLYKTLSYISKKSDKIRGQIVFWNSSLEARSKVGLSKINVDICETPLQQAFTDSGISVEDYYSVKSFPKSDEEDFFYCAGKQISMKRLLGVRSDTLLLTERVVNEKIPMGKKALQNAFWDYILPDKYVFPNWFGYFPKSKFYIDRPDIDNKLYDRVTTALKKGTNQPIILYGYPCSGKTFTIGALAYRIYKEKDYPVVFIRASEGYPMDEKALNNFLARIDDKTNKEKQILLIWDSSSEKHGENVTTDKLVNDVYRNLTENYGRNLVMLCTSYQYEKENAETALILDREIQDKDTFLKDFEEVLKKYNVMDNKHIYMLVSKYREKNKNGEELDITLLFDDLTTLYDGLFSSALKLEQNVLKEYVIEQMNRRRIDAQFEPFNNPFANMPWELFEFSEDNEYEKDDMICSDINNTDVSKEIEQFDRLCLCTALFGQIDLKMPFAIAAHLFPRINPYTVGFIPWFRYHYLEDSNIAYLCFRNIKEADIYLKNYFAVHHEKYQDVIKAVMKQVIEYFEEDIEMQYSDFIKKSVVDFLRYYGPNKVAGILPEYQKYKLKPCTLDELEEITEPIYRLIGSNAGHLLSSGYDDKDGSFANIYVNYNHEFFRSEYQAYSEYGNKGTSEMDVDTVEQYILQLQKVIGICSDSATNVKKYIGKKIYSDKYLTKQSNALKNESIICNTLLKQYQMKYVKICLSPKKELSDSLASTNFDDIYSSVSGIITCDPENDYNYNALLQFFEAYVEMEKYSKRSINVNYIAQIKNLIYEGENNLPDEKKGVGSEFWKHKIKFAEYEELPENGILDIYRIEKGEMGNYKKYYDDSKTKVGVIVYACQNTPDIEKVYQFLCREDIESVIRNNCYANEYHLRITWEHFTGRKFVFTEECECIGLTEQDWGKLYNICNDYFKNTEKMQSFVRKPAIILLYAMSMLQTGKKGYLDTIKFIKKYIREDMFSSYHARMRTPIMVCDENGIPRKYNGIVMDDKDGNVKIGDIYCRCNCHNIGAKTLPAVNTLMKNLELGLGYTGFSVYNENGRKRKQVANGNGNA